MDKNLSGMVEQTDYSQFDGLSGLYHHQQQSPQCQSNSPSTVGVCIFFMSNSIGLCVNESII